MKKKFHSLIWGLKIAIERNFRLLLFWLVISVATAFLPAVSILMYRNLLLHLSEFALLSNKMDVNLYQLISSLVKFCIVLAISGISLLINDNLLYVVMYDTYYLGLEETMMDAAQKIPIKELYQKKTSEEYFSAISRCGALTDVMSSGCVLFAKLITILSLLYTAFLILCIWPTKEATGAPKNGRRAFSAGH